MARVSCSSPEQDTTHAAGRLPGTCEPAFRFYEQALGGRITTLMRHGDMPEWRVPPDWADKVLHARLDIGNATLLGAHIPNAQPMRSAYVTLTVDTAEEAERIYRCSRRLRDRFGTSWMLLHGVTQ